ncbi:putative multi-sensor signal transduction histidine kinase [Actinoplanes missouriensis 431]|uniref:histidine kinase n=1 Tax=Actinoplanes missouriensis (strain ATCC 14538 / DSM 43046 / CBS 188.64 / JCM 3121 / NBRC 102363 / NCIMB 12654 / NRRL B-3342 / UNCC 431) TaxID=512565 RepID=I0H6H0_ACTM4|nr:sensor histidine kinase [Actinoplanes missouriensis]BAL88607.1 putative multi-sensor signal transduction histidine kinase [Actinoplanes missouriensis 431]
MQGADREELGAVVRIAAAVAGVPTAALNLIDEGRQVQVVTAGFPGRDCDRADAMCAVRLGTGRPVHVPDARLDPDYRDNPWVTGELGLVRFYANAPLITPDGSVLGTLCVFDTVPHELTAEQLDRLQDLAGVIVALVEGRRQTRTVAEFAQATEARKKWAEALLDGINVAVIAVDTQYRPILCNQAFRDSHDPGIDLTAAPVGIAERFQIYEPDGQTPITDEGTPMIMAMNGLGPVTGRELMLRGTRNGAAMVRANARALYGADGAISGAVLALHDITAEAARKRLIEEARSRLAAANAELRRSNTDLTNFAAGVSHDLVAPLAAVGGYLELLAEEVTEPAAGHVAAAGRAVEEMRDVIRSLLGAARSDTA